MRQNGIKRLRSVAWLTLALSLCVMTFTGFNLLDMQQTYQLGDDSYRALADRVRPAGPPDAHEPQAEPADGTATDLGIPDMAVDFAALQAINPDAVAWLYGPGTEIDYPVVRATEYNYYLHHLPDGTYNAYGTLFIDYNWTAFDDKLTVVYGHNMNNGRMFGSLVNYKDPAYLQAHPYLYLYTADGGSYRIDLLYGCLIGAGQWRNRALMFEVNLDALLAYAAHNTTFTSGAQYTPSDRVIALSTCSYEFDDARYVVIGILREAT